MVEGVTMAGHLTEVLIAKAVREARDAYSLKELSDPGQRGLWLRITKTGTRTWVLRARDWTGRFRTFVLGHHPEMGLSEAREEARKLRVQVRAGADPTAQRRAARATLAVSPPPRADPPVDTLDAVLAIYEAQRGNDLKSWAHSRKRVDRVFATLMARSIRDLTAADFQITADRFHARQSASFAVRTLRPVLHWAAKRGYCPPALAEFEQPAAVRQRHRVLAREELAALLPVLGDGPEAHGACLRFILLTAARLGEASTARWRDIDWQSGTWTIPREQAKSDREHTVPLSRQAIALLRRRVPPDAQPDELIFTTETRSLLGNWDRAGKWFQTASGTAGWHRHDLRRTAATLLGNLGTDPHVIEAALGHVTLHSGLASIYNRSRYRPQVAEALQRLADALDGITQCGAGILPLTVSI
jgi:integrase